MQNKIVENQVVQIQIVQKQWPNAISIAKGPSDPRGATEIISTAFDCSRNGAGLVLIDLCRPVWFTDNFSRQDFSGNPGRKTRSLLDFGQSEKNPGTSFVRIYDSLDVRQNRGVQARVQSSSTTETSRVPELSFRPAGLSLTRKKIVPEKSAFHFKDSPTGTD